MCSIYGAVGYDVEEMERWVRSLSRFAKDRGRDGGDIMQYQLDRGVFALLGNWRATPTTEAEVAPFQPYDGVVHNGTIANDKELGNPPGAVDSMILPKVLDRSDVHAFAASLQKVKGSYAVAAVAASTVLVAVNYKPLYYMKLGDSVFFSSMERHFRSLESYGMRPARLKPYTALDLLTGEVGLLPRWQPKRALVICSAGLDSTTAAAKLKHDGYEIALLHFNYGCRAEGPETERIRRIGDRLGAPVIIQPLDYSSMVGGSPLLDQSKEIAPSVAGAEFAHEWVPARNLLMIAHAVAYAEANDYGYVALGNNLEEAGSYPDNEEEFTGLLDMALEYAVSDGRRVQLLSPVGRLMKHEIVKLGLEIGAPLDLTWSCYRGGERHCGECGPCYMRKAAFARSGADDPVFAHERAALTS